MSMGCKIDSVNWRYKYSECADFYCTNRFINLYYSFLRLYKCSVPAPYHLYIDFDRQIFTVLYIMFNFTPMGAIYNHIALKDFTS